MEGVGRGSMLGQREARRVRGAPAETITPKDKRSRRGGVLQWRELSEELEESEESEVSSTRGSGDGETLRNGRKC